jgi:hypothetical protein
MISLFRRRTQENKPNISANKSKKPRFRWARSLLLAGALTLAACGGRRIPVNVDAGLDSRAPAADVRADSLKPQPDVQLQDMQPNPDFNDPLVKSKCITGVLCSDPMNSVELTFGEGDLVKVFGWTYAVNRINLTPLPGCTTFSLNDIRMTATTPNGQKFNITPNPNYCFEASEGCFSISPGTITASFSNKNGTCSLTNKRIKMEIRVAAQSKNPCSEAGVEMCSEEQENSRIKARFHDGFTLALKNFGIKNLGMNASGTMPVLDIIDKNCNSMVGNFMMAKNQKIKHSLKIGQENMELFITLLDFGPGKNPGTYWISLEVEANNCHEMNCNPMKKCGMSYFTQSSTLKEGESTTVMGRTVQVLKFNNTVLNPPGSTQCLVDTETVDLVVSSPILEKQKLQPAIENTCFTLESQTPSGADCFTVFVKTISHSTQFSNGQCVVSDDKVNLIIKTPMP